MSQLSLCLSHQSRELVIQTILSFNLNGIALNFPKDGQINHLTKLLQGELRYSGGQVGLVSIKNAEKEIK